MNELEIKASIQVLKPASEVFEAIVNPEKMSHYFISESTGRMENGKIVTWRFPEFEGSFPVEVEKVVAGEFISFRWEGSQGKQLLVTMKLEEREGNKTVVHITEGKMPQSEEGIAWYGRNNEGWANFLACLKAYLEYGINLRKGAFDFMNN